MNKFREIQKSLCDFLEISTIIIEHVVLYFNQYLFFYETCQCTKMTTMNEIADVFCFELILYLNKKTFSFIVRCAQFSENYYPI